MKRDFTSSLLNCLFGNGSIWCVLCAGLFLQPWVFWPPAAIAYEIPRVWFVRIWVVALAFLSVLYVLFAKKVEFGKVRQFLFLAVLGFLGVSLIASLFGPNIPKSIVGNPYRLDGLSTYLLLAGLAGIIAWQLKDRSPAVLVSVIGGSSVLLSAWTVVSGALFHIWKWWVPNWDGAMGISFGQPNFLAGYLLVTLPIYWYWWQGRKNRALQLLALLGLILQVIAIGLTFSWGGILGVGVLGALLVIHHVQPRRRWLLLVGTLVSIGWFVTAAVYMNWHDYNPEARSRIFTKVLEGYVQRPVLGWGWANVDYAFLAGTESLGYQHDIYLDKAHSTVLEVLVTTGLVGVAVYVVMLGLMWRGLKQHGAVWTTLSLMLLLYLYHSQTNVISIAEEVIFWFIAGTALVKRSTSNRS